MRLVTTYMSANYSAVLFSGGLDSAVLVADALAARAAAKAAAPVLALYVSVGFAWETEERAMAARLFAGPPFAGAVEPPVLLRFDMRDIFPSTPWAVPREPPAFDTPVQDVHPVWRSVFLL